MVKGIKDFEFQNDCVNFLIQKTVERDSKKVITVKAPTGAGKTIILIKYIDEYMNNTDNNTAFVWLCPGKETWKNKVRNKWNALHHREIREIYCIPY